MNKKLPLLLFFGLLITSVTFAQKYDKEFDTYLAFDFTKPFFSASDNEEGIPHTAVFGNLSGAFSYKQFSIAIGLPFSHYEYRDPGGAYNGIPAHSTIGNLSVDFSYLKQFPQFWFRTSATFKLPTMPDPDYPDEWGFFTGYFANIENRDSFAQDNFSYGFRIDGGTLLNQTLDLDVALGINNWTHVGEFDYIKDQLYVFHNIYLTFKNEAVDGFFGLAGNYKVSEAAYALVLKDDITLLEVGLSKEIKQVQVLTSINTPINNDFFTYGLNLSICYGF